MQPYHVMSPYITNLYMFKNIYQYIYTTPRKF
jgi:hypothetical protein